MFENRMLRKIFEPLRNEAKGSCRKMHNEKLHNGLSLLNNVRMNTLVKGIRKTWAQMGA
jgi:hypothetical protein